MHEENRCLRGLTKDRSVDWVIFFVKFVKKAVKHNIQLLYE